VLTSAPGKGTQADLYLPVAAEPVAVAAPEPVPHDAVPASSVLVVDDDVLIAMNTVDMVQDLGHAVLEANSGRQALDILMSGARVDAIVTDYAMPGMTGVELADRVWQMHPEMPILLATGYADLPDGTTSDLPRLAKPYLQSDLAQHLTRMLSVRSAQK
jgi:CheY-like chemotaxis protein